MGWFRWKSHMSLEINDLRLTMSVSISASTPERPERREVGHRRDLAAELAQYTTPSELLDLHAALDRYDDADTEDIRAILDAQARHRLTSPWTRSPTR